jgi:transcriptional regulator with XRE-family HTH domain
VDVTEDRSRLAAALKALRQESGLSSSALGQRLGWSQSRVSRTENGTRRVTAREVSAWAEAANAAPELRDQLVRQADLTASEVLSWWDAHTGGLVRRQNELAAAGSRATAIRSFHALIVPGLLQTDAFARLAIGAANVTGQQQDVDAAAAARVQRQSILLDPGKRFEFVLTPGALSWRLADDPGVMTAMAERIIATDSLANVTVAVIPPGAVAPVLPLAGFTMFAVPGEPFAILETLTTELVLTHERDLNVYGAAFGHLRAAAVTGPEAYSLIRAAVIPGT